MAFPSNCDLRVVQTSASTGCTLTRANILGMTPQAFEDQGYKEVGMDKVIARAQEAKIAGIQEDTLEMLLYGTYSPVKKGEIGTESVNGQSIILPYIIKNQKRNINSNWFLVDAGAATPSAGSNGIPTHAWDLTIKKNASPFATSLPNLQNYFLPGRVLAVDWYKVSDNTAYSAHFKILASVNADAGGVYKAKLTLAPNVSEAAWAGYDAATKAPWQPTLGVCYQLANNVSDFESWCYQDPAENVRKLLTFWMHTMRRTHEYNDEWLKALNAPLTSEYFKRFLQLPLAEQKRLQELQYRKAKLNSIMFGQQIDENQTVEGYRNLPGVYDPLNPSCLLEYKANMLGFFTQLNNCSRVYDSQGAALSLDRMFEAGYNMMRSREATGGSVDTIDWLTDRWTADLILRKMITFFKTRYSYDVTKTIAQGEALKFDNQVVLQYNTFQLPPALGGYTAAIFWLRFFDDYLQAHVASVSSAAPTGGLANRGRFLMALDWTDIRLGLVNATSVARETNKYDNLFNCIIKPNMRHYQLNSETLCPMIEDPARHEITYNFSEAEPTLT